MDLINRATQFIRDGHPNELSTLLADCVTAGNSEGMLAVKLLARDMYDGITFNLELKTPAAYCLLAWGQEGLETLVENALEEPTTKNFSMAFQLLASVAEGKEPRAISLMQSNSQLLGAVSRSVGDWNNLALAARSSLHELVLNLEDNATADLSAGTSLLTLAIQDKSAIKNLIHALALRSIAVGPRVLTEYDHLLTGPGDVECIFQDFFESHPLMLDSRAFQVWAKPDFHGRFEPDFVIRTYDNSYVVVEIEKPAKLLMTQERQVSADVSHAIRQVNDYMEYLRTHFAAATETFPEFTVPTGLVVVGLESTLNDGQKAALRRENQGRSDIRIVGFDELANTAKATTNSVIHGIHGVIKDTRLT